MRVRAFEEGDGGRLEEIFLAARRQAFFWVEGERFAREDLWAETEGEVLTVAEDGEGRVVGFMAVWERERFVHHLFVDPEAQGCGVGRALLASLPDGVYQLKCQVRNARAMGFYAHLGWEEQGRGRDLMGEYALLEKRVVRD